MGVSIQFQDSESADTEVLNQLAPKMSDFRQTLQARSSGKYLQIHGKDFDFCCQINMAEFHNLKAKLEPVTLQILHIQEKRISQ